MDIEYPSANLRLKLCIKLAKAALFPLDCSPVLPPEIRAELFDVTVDRLYALGDNELLALISQEFPK